MEFTSNWLITAIFSFIALLFTIARATSEETKKSLTGEKPVFFVQF